MVPLGVLFGAREEEEEDRQKSYSLRLIATRPALIIVFNHHHSAMSSLRSSLVSTARIATRQAVCKRTGTPGAYVAQGQRHIRLITKPAYPGHIPLNFFENAVLAVGSAFMSLADPRRGGKLKSDY